MPIFLLIRHGETDYNKKMHLAGRLPNVHLTQKGRQQAQLIADKLGAARRPQRPARRFLAAA